MDERIVKLVALAMEERAAQPLYNIPTLTRVPVGSLGDAWKHIARAAIAAHLAALREAGFEVVPREPNRSGNDE